MTPNESITPDLAERMADQRERMRLNGCAFSFDRNGFRLGIASLEDEIKELYDAWQANKRRLHGAAGELRHELLDIAGIAMLMLENVPSEEPSQ